MTEGMHFRAPRISKYVLVMMLDLAFYTKYPDGMGDAVKKFLFPDLSPASGSEAALLTRQWDSVLGGGTLTSFSDTSRLIVWQNVNPVATREKAALQLDIWSMFSTVFLGDVRVHPTAFEMVTLVKDTASVIAQIRSQGRCQASFPDALLHLIQTEFKESFHQALEHHQPVQYTNFEGLHISLTTGNF